MKHLKATSALMLKIILGNKWHLFKKNRVANLKFAHEKWFLEHVLIKQKLKFKWSYVEKSWLHLHSMKHHTLCKA